MKFRIYVVAVFCIIYVAGASAAPIENPGFETGNINGWDAVYSNDGPKEDDDYDSYTPTEGDYYAWLEATSTISQQIDYTDGMVLGFDWNFIAKDEIQYANDYAFYSVDSFVKTLASVSTVGDYTATGWKSEEYLFQGNGSALLTFGVNNVDGDEYNSKLLVDNITLTEASVPEPSVIALFSIGLLGLGFAGRRRKV